MLGRKTKRLSTSSSSGARGLGFEILAAVAVVLVMFAALEVPFRAALPRLSLNSRVLSEAGARAERIRAANAPSVLVLGNSVGRNALDIDYLTQRLAADGVNVHLEHQPADGSQLADWTLELKNMFIAHNAAPNWLVLPVGLAAPLSQIAAPSEDLAHSFAAFSDFPAVFEGLEIDGFEGRAGLVWLKSSALFGFRGRMQREFFVRLVPGYADLKRHMLEQSDTASPLGLPRRTRYWVNALAELAQAHAICVVILVVPTVPLAGRLPADERAWADSYGFTVLEPAPQVYPAELVGDGVHLNEAGRNAFTQAAEPLFAQTFRHMPNGGCHAPP